MKETFKSGCLICGEELEYLPEENTENCTFCGNEFQVEVRCKKGHFVCDNCHQGSASEIIKHICLNADTTNPIQLAEKIMEHPSLAMHGPEHHVLVPAVMLSTWAYKTGNKENLPDLLNKAIARGTKVPGGFCGSHGNCGAAVGVGIFISLITGSTPLETTSWQWSNRTTGEALLKIADLGGPRCCKRDSFISIIHAVEKLHQYLDVSLDLPEDIHCKFSSLNKQCRKIECPFFQALSQ